MEQIDLKTNTVKLLRYNSETAVNIHSERRWHAGLSIGNSYFIYAGWREAPLDDMLQLDLETMKWTIINFQGDEKPGARRWHSLTQIDNSNLFIFGGYNGNYAKPMDDFHLFNLEKLVWTTPTLKGSKPSGRYGHTVTKIDNKTYYFLGGRNPLKDPHQDSFILHLDDMSWQLVKNSGELFPVNRALHKAAKISEHGLVVVGGTTPTYIDQAYYLDLRYLKV
eukprot:TRINITY_DN613_c0_g2_i2.p1 TRINITY_DN613_c0_g2~~TRINITY_DN613_c0_g2_i2.p1  ORF type:complete len:222 (-),score=27.91 TRINITY_DN613_c0_g2_i2:147-812(-)